MYLHLGQSVVVPHGDIIGIFDLDNASYSNRTREFLDRAQREGRVTAVSDDLPKSFVLCQEEDNSACVYITQLSSATLRGRVENNSFE